MLQRQTTVLSETQLCQKGSYQSFSSWHNCCSYRPFPSEKKSSDESFGPIPSQDVDIFPSLKQRKISSIVGLIDCVNITEGLLAWTMDKQKAGRVNKWSMYRTNSCWRINVKWLKSELLCLVIIVAWRGMKVRDHFHHSDKEKSCQDVMKKHWYGHSKRPSSSAGTLRSCSWTLSISLTTYIGFWHLWEQMTTVDFNLLLLLLWIISWLDDDSTRRCLLDWCQRLQRHPMLVATSGRLVLEERPCVEEFSGEEVLRHVVNDGYPNELVALDADNRPRLQGKEAERRAEADSRCTNSWWNIIKTKTREKAQVVMKILSLSRSLIAVMFDSFHADMIRRLRDTVRIEMRVKEREREREREIDM